MPYGVRVEMTPDGLFRTMISEFDPGTGKTHGYMEITECEDLEYGTRECIRRFEKRWADQNRVVTYVFNPITNAWEEPDCITVAEATFASYHHLGIKAPVAS